MSAGPTGPPWPRQTPAKRWFGRTKLNLGYNEWRARKWEFQVVGEMRPSDVMLVGHPKSGNTWLAYMLALLLFPDRDEEVTLANVAEFVPYVHGRDRDIANFPHLADPRVFRNECPMHPRLYDRVIYVMRDPRAVLVSFWHMYRTMFDDQEMPMAAFVEQYMNHDGCFRHWYSRLYRWDVQVDRFLRRSRTDAMVHVVSYEDLVSDRVGELRRLAAFLGLDVSDERLLQIGDRGDFRSMQEMETAHGAEAYLDGARGPGQFVRRGKIDGWRDEMDDELAESVAKRFQRTMRLAGYS